MVSYARALRRSALLTLLVLSMAGGMLALVACSAGLTNNGCASGYAPAENNASSCCPYGLPFAAGNGYCYESEVAAARFLSLPGRIATACGRLGLPYENLSNLIDHARDGRDHGNSRAVTHQQGTDACIEIGGQELASDCAACMSAVVEVAYQDDTSSGNDDGPMEGCRSDADCDDGLFCNGSETCYRAGGRCFVVDIPCGNEPCDETRDRCGTDEHEAECTSELEVNAVLEASWQVLGLSWLDPSAGVIASAFAVDKNKLATNAHVVLGLVNVLSTGGIAAVVQDETGTELHVVRMWVHPDYNGDSITSPDVAVIEVDGRLPSHLTLGSNATVQNLEVLEELTLCGFPGDVSVLVDFANLQPGDEFRPRASCFTGGISSLRPFDPSVAATEVNSQLIQHSVGTTGGTSGSPMLDDCGVVVGVHAAATLDVAGTNRFATRADALADLLDMIESGAVNPVEIPSGDDGPLFDVATVLDGDWVLYRPTGEPHACMEFNQGLLVFHDSTCYVDSEGFLPNDLDAVAEATSDGRHVFLSYSFTIVDTFDESIIGTFVSEDEIEVILSGVVRNDPSVAATFSSVLVRQTF